MALRNIMYTFKADGSQFISEQKKMEGTTNRAAASATQGWTRAAGAVAGITAAATTAINVINELDEAMRRLDREAIDQVVRTGLVGGDPAAAQAWELLRERTGVGAEQVFDTAEAVRDAIAVKGGPDASAAQRRELDEALAGIGVDRDFFMELDTPALMVDYLLDSLVASGGAADENVLKAASVLGAGDIRDMASLTSLIATTDKAHPRFLRTMLSQVQPDEATLKSSIEDDLMFGIYQQAARNQNMMTGELGGLGELVSKIPFVGTNFQQQQGQAFINDRFNTVVIKDETAGGIATKELLDDFDTPSNTRPRGR